MKIDVRLGGPDDVEPALSIYELSNLARRRGDWPSRQARLQHVAANLRDPSSWFVIAHDAAEAVAMASVLPFRSDDGAGPPVPHTVFLDLIYVLPERWGEGIGGVVLDAVIDEAKRRGMRRIHLWTHEDDNERAHRLYRSRGFAPTARTTLNDRGQAAREWLLEM